MNPVVSFLLSQIILLPLLIGLVLYRCTRTRYQPFLLLLMVGFLSELISFIFIKFYRTSNAGVQNVYILIEWILLLLQFQSWGFFKKGKKGIWLLMTAGVIIWIVENVIAGRFNSDFSSYYTLAYCFLIVMVSVRTINYFIIHENNNIFRNPVFLMTLGFVIFFIYRMLYEWSFKMAVLQETDASQDVIISSFSYVNVLVNLIYAVAFLMVPAEKKLI